jgi:GPH family glycoside/pentoside/hexuronide:cation symporter
MTPIQGRVPTRLAIANGLGSVAYGIKDNGFSTFLLLFYNQVLGMDARLVSLALLIALVFDGLIDPIVGHIGDRTDTRWGRRLPYLYVAPIFLGVFWVLLWSPPAGAASFPMLLLSAVAVRAAVAFCEVPSAALVAEITRDYDERTRLTRIRYLCAWGGGLLMLLLAYGVFLPKAMLAREGYQNYGIAGAVLMVATVLLSAWGQHKWVGHRAEFKAPGKAGIGGAFSEIRESLSHPAFVVLMFAIGAAITSQGITFSISNYLYLFVWKFPPLALQLYPLLLFCSVIGSFLIVGPLQARFGKRETAAVAAVLGMVFWVTPLSLRHFGLWWPDGSIPSLAAMFGATFFSNMFSVVAGIALSSMVADVVEASQEQTGRRSEGTFAAGAFFAAKCSTGVGIFITGFLLSLSGMPSGAKPGQVPENVVDTLAMAYASCVFVLAILVVLIVRRFPITRTEHQARLALLDQAAKADPEATGHHP